MSSKKTLLQINVTANWGSTGKIAEQIGLSAQSNGWESYIAYGRSKNLSQNRLIKIGNKFDTYEHFAENLIFDNEGLASRFSTKCFIKQIEKIQPDVVHLHNIHGYYLNYQILFEYLQSLDVPVIWTLHDCWPFTGHCSHFDIIKCEKWKTGCHHCELTRAYPASFCIDNSMRNYRLKKSLFSSLRNLVIVPVSDWLGGIVRDSFLGKYPINVIHNGIDLNIFRPTDSLGLRRKLNIPKEKIIVLGVASPWTKLKGENDMLEIAKDSRFQVIMVGVSDTQRIEYENKNIIAINRTNNQEELAQYYSMADVFVNPTYSDNFPTTNLEALACGTPVITYRTGGSPEAIDDKTGLVVDQGNIQGLMESIQKLHTNPLSSVSCRQRAECYFDRNNCFESYIQLYTSLL